MAGPTQMHTMDCLDNPDLSQQDQHQYQVSAPLLFIGYPPAVFDLLKPDDDDRIIIWGPDPKAVSASMATTTTATTRQTQESSNVPSKSKSPTLNSTADLPLSSPSPSPSTPPAPMRGFSSNTTTSVANLSSREDHGRPRLLSGKLTDGLRKTLRSHSLMHRSSADNLKSILLLKRTFGNSKLKHQQHMNSISQSGSTTTLSTSNKHVAKVIEAASVEKLVEKLTNTLDYEFMTDFFLTYRSFISPTQLCKLLILRFRWALENDEEDRRIVRIRTFVVMRHWLLNYFVHDFIPIRDLRVVLTTFLNALPSHSLVRSSPRDQRIVKGLKRVVRRLKKVYYHGTNSQRVQVIAPPPPSSDQERVEEMVRANLAHGLLRRKTALVRGVDVGGKHNGNMAVQDARRAPMVVIGNVHGNKTDFQVQNQQQQQIQVNDTALATSDVSIVSSKNTTLMDNAMARAFILKETQNDQVTTAKQSYLQRMEVERKMNALSSSQDFHGSAGASQASVASDDSLESALSPGTTEIASDDDYYNDENDTGTLNSGDNGDDDDDTGSSIPHQQWKSEYQQSKLEHERRRREEEEERRRAEFFSVPETKTDNMVEIATDGQPSLSDLYISDSRISLQRSLSSVSEIITPTVSTNAIKNLDKTNSSNRQQQQPNQHTLDITEEDVEMTEEQAAVLASLERIDGPIRKAAIGDTSSRIRRVPSSKWCQLSPDEETSTSRQQNVPRMPSKGFTEDFIRKLDIGDNISVDNMNDISKQLAPGSQSHSLDSRDSIVNHNVGAIGLSRHLSRKSIERRKSEKSLRDVAAADMAKLLRKSASTPSSPHHHHHSTANDSDIPDMPPLPERTTNVPLDAGNGLLRHLQHKNSFTDPPAIEGQKPAFILSANIGHTDDDFEAIPYDQTVSPASMNESFATQTSPGGHRRGLSKKFVNMVFSRSTSSPAGLNSSTEKTPATPAPVASVPSTVATPSSSAKVSTENSNFNADNMTTSLSTASSSTPATTSQPTNSVTPKKNGSAPVSPPPPNSTLVSRIAQELRESENDFEIQCDCMRCTGATTGPRACRRFSLALLTDDEKRQSMELRRRRGASIDKGNRRPLEQHMMGADNLLGETSNYIRPAAVQNGPMYLGQLNAAYSHSASDIGMHIEEIDEVDGDEKDDDSGSSSSSLSNSSTSSGNINNSDHQNNSYGRRYKQQEMTKRIKKHYLNVSNGSLDCLTGVSTKGDGTSLHRQQFSTTSIHSMDPSPHDIHDSAAHPQPSSSTETPAPATFDIPLPSSESTIPPWIPAHVSHDMMDEVTTTNGTTHYEQSAPMQSTPSSFILSYRSGKMAQQLCFIERDVLLGVDWEKWYIVNGPRWQQMKQQCVTATIVSMAISTMHILIFLPLSAWMTKSIIQDKFGKCNSRDKTAMVASSR
ncbi:unnamed protein product [Absidia cylindrospora]